MAEIRLQNVTKAFGTGEDDVVAVDDLSLTIHDGEFVVLVGPSGCGKTTTLRVIAGLEDVTSGAVRFGGQDVTELRGRDRDVAMVFQNYALYPHMSVESNIGFGLKLTTKLSSAEIAECVRSTTELLGIEHLLENKPSELSGGQQQRVALGRAIVRDPEIFLLDEPLSNLDAKLRDDMRTEIQQLQAELGVTTVYVTHDQTEAMAMGDRIAVMHDGELQQIGVPEELYRDPTNEFVGGFIGSPSMNLLSGEVGRESDHGVRLRGPEGFSYDLRNADVVGEREAVRIGVRPEDLTTVENGGIEAVVKVVEPMGNENFVYLDVGGVELTARFESATRPRTDETIEFTFAEDDLYLFDAASGAALKTKSGAVDHARYLEAE